MSTIDALLDPAVPLDRVLTRVRRRWASHQRSEAELCVGLRRLYRDQAHRGLGRSKFSRYIHAETGMPEKLVWIFMNLGKHFERLPLIREAMERGVLSYTKAREFAPSIRPDEQEHWIEFAKGHTNREIEREVAKVNAEREGREFQPKVSVVLWLTGVEFQALRAAREMVMKELREPVPFDRLVPMLAESALAGELPGGSDGNGWKGPKSKKLLPYAALCHCPFCLHTWVPIPGENLEVRVSEWVDNLRAGAEFMNLLPDFLCECEDVKHRRDQCPNRKEPWGEAAIRRFLPAAERKRIAARDGHRCRTPDCGNPVPIEVGHMEKPFREGVPMTREFLGQQCATCNDLIESGKLRVMGLPPFEQYYLADGTFLGFGFDPKPWASLPHVGDGSGRVRERPPGWSGGPIRAARAASRGLEPGPGGLRRRW